MADVLEWQALRDALAVEVGRVTTLLREVSDEPRPAVLGRWDLADVAMHLSQAWIAMPGLARADLTEVEAIVPDRGAGQAVARNVKQLGAVTTRAVAADPERDLGVLAGRIETRARDYLACCATADPDLCRPWLLSGITVPPQVFTAHLLSETVVHGADIAAAAGRPWRIEPAHAALVVRWFLFELLLNGAPQLLGDTGTLATLQGSYRFDVRGHGSVRMVFDESGARLDADAGPRASDAGPRAADADAGPRGTDAGRRGADCRMSLDPVAFLLMFFGRRTLAATVVRGGVLVWGRKPWLGVRLQRALPTP